MTRADVEMVVLGDSLAQGREDPDPAGGWIGWARRLAERLAIPDEKVLNAGREGATATSVATDQLAAVRDTLPRLVGLSCGMNDLLVGFERADVAAALGEVFGWARDAGAVTIASAVPVPPVIEQPIISRFRRNRILERLREYNEVLYRSAEQYGVRCLGPETMREVADARFWSPDGIHLNSAGHIYGAEKMEKLVAFKLPEKTR